MAKGQVPKHAFKPGQSGNPKGRPKLPADVLESRKQNTVSVARILNKFMNMNIEELKLLMNDKKTQNLELMIGRIIIEAIKTGDYTRLNFILDRSIGKVTEKVEHKLPTPTLVKLLDGSSIMLGSKKEEDEYE